MPSLFSRLKGKDGHKLKSKKHQHGGDLADQVPQKPRWEDAWTRSTIEPDEVEELVVLCTEELKARALDIPFLLLPFRPTSDPSAVRTFVRHFFDGNQSMRGEALAQELRMTEPMVISGVIKWCWSRLQGGVVGWDSYELFKVGEQDSQMARDSFTTFIPLSVDNESRSKIIFKFFDLLSAVAAHGKKNGFGGRKLSRMAAWWAFEHKDNGNGFEGGYKTWLNAADATSHLFFAYLRSLAPQQPTRGGISMLPMSLEKLLAETEYPPHRPALMQSTTNKVIMIVDTVSPTPFALLRRANHFQYRDEDRALREWSDYDDPVQALTEECRRVLRAISAANQSQAVSSSKHSTSLRDASWSRFEDIGFASSLEDEDDYEERVANRRTRGLRTTAASGGLGRPTTPSWADFLSSGFVDDGANGPSNMLLPPDKVLPPIETAVRQRSSQSHKPRLESDRNLEPGELASITRFDLDDSFWWVWMSSLAPEETLERKSAFGRCAVVETVIRTGRWLVMEEMVKGAAPEPEAGAYIAEKKSFFSWTRRGRTGGVSRSKSTGKAALSKGDGLKTSQTLGNFSKTSFGPDQQAKIQAAAQQLQARQLQEKQQSQQQRTGRRGRNDADLIAEKTNSIMTLQPGILSEASPAVKWANKYDKETIRDAYLANANAGRGLAAATMQTNGHGATHGNDRPPEVPSKSPSLVAQPSPAAMPKSPEPPVEDEPSPLVENPQPPADEGRVTPLPPPKDEGSMEVDRNNMISPEPGLSPESKKHKKLHKDEKKGGGGFRKLFGRRNRQSKVPDNAADQLKAMETERAASATPQPVVEERPEIHREETQYVTPNEEVPEPEPTEPTAPTPIQEPIYEVDEHEDVSRVNTAEAAEAHQEFSRFDQGPLLDQPAFVPDDASDDEAVPPPIARHPSRSPIPQAETESGEATPKAAPSQDRWAQLRKHAAEKAANRQAEEEHGGFTKTTDGDDETSGEETIESRVARIKARVAQLTGNMEGMGGPASGSTSPPIRR